MPNVNDHIDEEQELVRLIGKARAALDEDGDLARLGQAIRAEQSVQNKTDLRTAELVFEKWRILHKYIHARPFRLADGLKRSDEWRQVMKRYAPLGVLELSEWLTMQIDVATNREEGISDLRIRRDGPCYLIVLEYAGNKKRTALAVLHWAKEEAREEGR